MEGNGVENELVKYDEASVAKDSIHGFDDVAEEISVLGDSGPAPRQPDEPELNYKLQVSSRLFDILSDQSDVEHPLCEECSDFVMDQMDRKLRLLEDEYKEYRNLLDTLESRKQSEDPDKEAQTISKLQEEVDRLQLEESDLLRQLEELGEEQKSVEKDVEQHELELARISQEENKYWQEYNNLKRTFNACDDELQSVNNQLRYSQAQLDKLKRTNAFNATFHIWYVRHVLRSVSM